MALTATGALSKTFNENIYLKENFLDKKFILFLYCL
jgi:hypothetical protein